MKSVADTYVKSMPEGMNVTFTQDKSVFVNQLLGDLQNHVMIAVILVFIVILYALSGRASLLIGFAIPSSFLIGILLLAMMGFTINMIVLFSLILAVGMLVDDAIIVTEFAERRMTEGMPKEEAFALAANRMAGPVIAATMTRIAAFSPLLFWPGIVGDFMKYLPITLIVTLAASMLYALIFTPTLGAMFAKAPKYHEADHRDGWYMAIVRQAVRFPITVMVLTVALLVGVFVAYGKYGAGVEFFPNVEPDYGLLYVHARGNLSLAEMDAATKAAEDRLLGWPGVKSVYTRVGKSQGGGGQDVPEDVVGVIQYEFVDWRERKSANQILDDLRAVMAGIPGVDVEVRVPEAGPPTGKPIQVRLSAADPAGLDKKAQAVAARIAKVPGVIDISDGLPPPGVDWAIQVDRAKAAQFGVNPTSVGTAVQLVTNGLKLSEYRPAGVDDAVDIRLRLPEDRRTLSTLDELRVETQQGSVPISNFVERKAERTVGILNRIDGQRTIVVQANVAAGLQVAAVQQQVTPGDRRDGSRQRHALEAGRLQRGQRGGERLPEPGLRRRHLPDLPGAAGAVQQVHQRLAGVVLRGDGDDRRVPRPASDGPAVRHRDVRHRRDCAGRRGGEQQHRADRHLRPAARGRLGQDGGGAADLPRARAAGRADGRVRHPGRGADRLRPRAGDLPPGDDDQRAVDAMVDFTVLGDRVRPVVRDRADAGRDAGDADGVHARAPEGQAARLVQPAVQARQAGRGAGGRSRRGRCRSDRRSPFRRPPNRPRQVNRAQVVEPPVPVEH